MIISLTSLLLRFVVPLVSLGTDSAFDVFESPDVDCALLTTVDRVSNDTTAGLDIATAVGLSKLLIAEKKDGSAERIDSRGNSPSILLLQFSSDRKDQSHGLCCLLYRVSREHLCFPRKDNNAIKLKAQRFQTKIGCLPVRK